MLFGSLGRCRSNAYKAVVEMPAGTKHKYEVDKNSGMLLLDRVIDVPVPVNYGYVVNTIAEDGDPTDVFIAAQEPIPALTIVKIDVVGIIKCNDAGVEDDKVLAYIKGDKRTKNLFNVDELTTAVKIYLMSYKKGIEIKSIESTDAALETIENNTLLFFSKDK